MFSLQNVRILMDVSLEAVGAEEVGDIALNFVQRRIALVKEARCQREQRNVHIAAGLLHELVDAGLVFMALMTGEQNRVNRVVLNFITKVFDQRVASFFNTFWLAAETTPPAEVA